ncbi:MAG TPA: RNA polymerase sigma factor RpoD/SigA [Solirubrobacteraceae bacterium]|nr:RNA polymerase sigma factor RpoD/SigA [Solirubrobacteraceae bacterium]HME03034.1 RNA polymerase sigma factor RpoD/SigA [Solirubrobacteraceae bacterium]
MSNAIEHTGVRRHLGGPPARRGRNRRLTAAEERALARRIEHGDADAKREMVECNMGLVYTVASPYRGRGVPFADLVQEGAVGLIRAVEGFDHTRGIKFSTYAVWWIRRSLLDAIGAARTIRIPPQAAQQLAVVRRAEDELTRIGKESATTTAIAQRTGLSRPSVAALRDAARVTSSLDEPVGNEARPLGEGIEDPQGVDPERRLAEHELRQEAWSLLGTLPVRHRQVLMRRYGLGGTSVQSHREIGELLGVKEERSRQLEREALHRLREIAAPGRRAAA